MRTRRSNLKAGFFCIDKKFRVIADFLDPTIFLEDMRPMFIQDRIKQKNLRRDGR